MCMINSLEALKVLYTIYTTDKDVQPSITAKPWWTGMAVTCDTGFGRFRFVVTIKELKLHEF